MKEIIKYWKKWSKDPDIQEKIVIKFKQEAKLHSVEVVYKNSLSHMNEY